MRRTHLGGALRRAFMAAALVVGLGAAGCGVQVPADSVVVKKDQVAELERRGEAVARCKTDLAQAGKAHEATRRKLAASEAQVATLQARIGKGGFTPKHLKAADRGWQLALPKVARLDAKDARAARTTLAKALAGKRATVVAYWATWCKPCTSPEELALMATLRAELAHYDGQLLSFAVDGLDKVQGDARAATWLYPLYQRDNGHLESLPEALVKTTGLGLPLFVVVDAKGQLSWLRKGRLDEHVVAELVTAAARVGR